MIGWIIITTIDTNGSWRSCHRTSIMSTLQQESIHWRELFAVRKANIYSLKQIYKNVLDKGYNLVHVQSFCKKYLWKKENAECQVFRCETVLHWHFERGQFVLKYIVESEGVSGYV